MKRSQLFVRTQKDAPSDEVAKNAQLLIRAGYVYKVMAGVYAYTPLGIRVLEKIKHVVREEMNAIGGQELIMTALQRRETWETTGRWDDEVVDVWFKTKLKDETEVGLAWSHEEAIIEMMKQHVKSYKDMPQNVYQFQTKFRNELRSKSGIMRGREFVMKDMYSCSLDAEQHEKFYQATTDAYMNVFKRLGIGDETYVTFASGGAFTQFSHEFQTICDAGEDEIFLDEASGNYLNKEIVSAKVAIANTQDEPLELEEHELHDVIGVDALIKHFNIPIQKSTKALYFDTEKGDTVLAVVRSDYSIDTVKLASACDAKFVQMTDSRKISTLTGAEVGYAGLLNVPAGIKVLIDDSLEGATNFETGCNKTGYHAINVNFGRDVEAPEKYVDIKVPNNGDINPATNKPFPIFKTAEVGNIFNFGTQKSEDTDFAFTNEKGEKQYVHLGSYGIGVTRVMGVIAEKMSDEHGLVWSPNIAPYHVYLASIGDIEDEADKLLAELEEAGVEVLYDDRKERPGEKFADADLMGIPYRIVISQRTLEAQQVELKNRASGEIQMVPLKEIVTLITANMKNC